MSYVARRKLNFQQQEDAAAISDQGLRDMMRRETR